MFSPLQPVRMVRVDAKQFESVGYLSSKRQLFVRFRDASTLCFEDVPHFRHAGLLSAPRKDGYFKAFIKDRFLAKPVQLPPG